MSFPGIAYTFLRASQSSHFRQDPAMLNYAETYIIYAKNMAKFYAKRHDERFAFLCGNAGIYAVAAAIANEQKNPDGIIDEILKFQEGFEPCKQSNNDHGNDEILVGRAGYLSGMYWLNSQLKPAPFSNAQILEICEEMVESGKQYSTRKRSPIPLMYQYHGTEYLGAAHGVCAILHMLLESPWFKNTETSRWNIDIKNSVDQFLSLQEKDGNFPVRLERPGDRHEKRLVHWCHGAPGAIYLLVKAYLVFKENRYLEACKKAADLVWERGLLYKGPGICHGVAGNGYVFLIMYRLTNDDKYLYRAYKFMEFLTDKDFCRLARTPDRPFSLYEGTAGTICYLLDLLEPEKAAFPFMDVFS